MSDDATPSGGESQKTEYSPAALQAPDPELEDGEVVCAGCGESDPVSDMGATADKEVQTESGAVAYLTRYYLHDDEDCQIQFLEDKNAE